MCEGNRSHASVRRPTQHRAVRRVFGKLMGRGMYGSGGRQPLAVECLDVRRGAKVSRAHRPVHLTSCKNSNDEISFLHMVVFLQIEISSWITLDI